jgi:hypothetical protein
MGERGEERLAWLLDARPAKEGHAMAQGFRITYATMSADN